MYRERERDGNRERERERELAAQQDGNQTKATLRQTPKWWCMQGTKILVQSREHQQKEGYAIHNQQYEKQGLLNADMSTSQVVIFHNHTRSGMHKIIRFPPDSVRSAVAWNIWGAGYMAIYGPKPDTNISNQLPTNSQLRGAEDPRRTQATQKEVLGKPKVWTPTASQPLLSITIVSYNLQKHYICFYLSISQVRLVYNSDLLSMAFTSDRASNQPVTNIWTMRFEAMEPTKIPWNQPIPSSTG